MLVDTETEAAMRFRDLLALGSLLQRMLQSNPDCSIKQPQVWGVGCTL